MESIKKRFTDIAEALVFWVGAVIGLRRFKPQIDVTIDFVAAGAEASARAVKRLFNHNLVVALRPVYSKLTMAQAMFSLLGFIPIALLSYGWACLIYTICSASMIVLMIVRRRRLNGVMPFEDLDALMAPDRLIRGFGPDDRFSTLDFIGFPVIIALQSALIMTVALVVRASYGTSMAFIWPMMFVAGIGFVFAYNVNRFFLYLAMLVVEGPAEWAEKAFGRLAKAVLSPALLGIDDGNVADLLPDSLVNELKSFINTAQGMLAKTYHLAIPMLMVAAVTSHLEIVFVTSIATFFFGLYQNSRISRGGKDTDEARASISRAEKFLYGLSVVIFIVHLVELKLFGWHALPATESVAVQASRLTQLITQNLILLLIISTVLGFVARWLINGTFDKPLLTLPKAAGLIVAAFAVLLTVIGWFDTAGVLVRTEDSYFHRFDHPSDEALHCLNGMQDYDEDYTDHGESCGPYRRPHNTAEYQSSASSPFTTEPVAGGNLFQRLGCWMFDRGCVGQVERTERRGLGNGPQGSSNRMALLASNEPTAKAFHPPSARPVSDFDPIIERASRDHSVDADLIRAVIMVESRFNPNAVSRTGCQGLMQLCPSAARSVGVTNRMDPTQSIMGGTQYLRRLIDRHNSVRTALAAYYAGSGNLGAGWGYADRVLHYFHGYQNGYSFETMPSYRSSRIAQDTTTNDEVDTRQEIAEVDLSANADACATMSEPILEIMRLRGRCP